MGFLYAVCSLHTGISLVIKYINIQSSDNYVVQNLAKTSYCGNSFQEKEQTRQKKKYLYDLVMTGIIILVDFLAIKAEFINFKLQTNFSLCNMSNKPCVVLLVL
jgi:hypothetical protein